MKAYKVEILVIDHDGLGANGIKDVFENTKYPNWCMYPSVKKITSADIGKWSDSHVLNQYATMDAEYDRLFGGKS